MWTWQGIVITDVLSSSLMVLHHAGSDVELSCALTSGKSMKYPSKIYVEGSAPRRRGIMSEGDCCLVRNTGTSCDTPGGCPSQGDVVQQYGGLSLLFQLG